ncbi:MAG: sigma 54-interacting transcriptional regulator, partial [Bdellovibrionaceae bacterium]|nr:sigma 54-interacting transcriptional regulator [Pseudobdellovibrionaceae bacterium]
MAYKIEQLDGTRSVWNIGIEEATDSYTHIGKDSSCHIQISELEVEARHCRLEIKDGKLFIKDMRSNTGTFVNGAQILEAQLHDGDIISTGYAEFVVHDLASKKILFPLVSKSISWNEQLRSLETVCPTDHTVLLLGSSGSGKDVIARNIHDYSHRNQNLFLSVNCSALTETLVESELFGHIKGSFTGAINDRKGAFEAARGGTLFLDEIGDLSFSLQAKLLRALENEEIRPVGSDKNIKTNVRVIAATHQNLYSKIQEGSFRSDLFYRLNIINIEVPSLKDRMEDFDEIVYSFARKMRVRFSFSAIQKLKKYEWPGNIRELKNVVTRASTLYAKQYITDDIIDKLIHRKEHIDAHVRTNHPPQSGSVIKEIEKQMILKRLVANGGSQKRTASDLGIPKSTLHDR